MQNTLPYKTVKKILKEYVKGEVTHESVIYVKDLLEDISKLIATRSIKEFEEYNHLREIQKLPKLKRIPSSIYLRLCEGLYKCVVDFKLGAKGQHNRETFVSSKQVST